jgi:cytochrome bd-type quinol oxidase subunit 1
MNAPFFSSFSAIAELFVTAGVLYVVLRNYRQHPFAAKLAAAVVTFEFSVNMMYMIFRMRETTATSHAEAAASPLAPFMAAHGILSLLVFVLLVVYSYMAYVASKGGRHFFHDHPVVTWSFVGMWMLSVGSGEILYAINYL